MKNKRLKYQIISRCMAIAMLFIVPAGVLHAQDSTVSVQETFSNAHEAGISESVIQDFKNRTSSHHLSDDEINGMIKPVVNLASENLPYQYVMKKAMEGLAKDVDPGRIIQVEMNLQNNIRSAAQMADPWLQKPDIQQMLKRSGFGGTPASYRNEVIETVAGVLFQNVKTQEVSDLLSAIAEKNVADKLSALQVPAAISIYSELPTTHKHPEVSRSLIIEAIKAHFKPDQMQQLPVALSRAEVADRLPVEIVAKGVANQMGQGMQAVDILKNLFQGDVPGGPHGTPPGFNNNNHGNGSGNGHNPGAGNPGGNGHNGGAGNGHGNNGSGNL